MKSERASEDPFDLASGALPQRLFPRLRDARLRPQNTYEITHQEIKLCSSSIHSASDCWLAAVEWQTDADGSAEAGGLLGKLSPTRVCRANIGLNKTLRHPQLRRAGV